VNIFLNIFPSQGDRVYEYMVIAYRLAISTLGWRDRLPAPITILLLDDAQSDRRMAEGINRGDELARRMARRGKSCFLAFP
jgi:hypothetical protein